MKVQRTLKDSWRGEVRVHKQTGPHTVERVGIPAYIAVSIDVDRLLDRLGEKALKAKGKRATAFHGALVVQVKEIAS